MLSSYLNIFHSLPRSNYIQNLNLSCNLLLISCIYLDNLVKEDANQLLESSLLLFNGNTTSLRDNGTRFQTAIDKLEDTTIRLGTKQGDIGTWITTDLRPAIGTIRSDINKYSQNVNTYRSDLIGMEHRLIKRFEKLEIRLGTKVDSVNEKLGTVDKKLDSVISKAIPFNIF